MSFSEQWNEVKVMMCNLPGWAIRDLLLLSFSLGIRSLQSQLFVRIARDHHAVRKPMLDTWKSSLLGES